MAFQRLLAAAVLLLAARKYCGEVLLLVIAQLNPLNQLDPFFDNSVQNWCFIPSQRAAPDPLPFHQGPCLAASRKTNGNRAWSHWMECQKERSSFLQW